MHRMNVVSTPVRPFCIGCIFFAVVSGLISVFFGTVAIDVQLHDTYYVFTHLHLFITAALLFGMIAGIYDAYSRLLGRVTNATLGRLHFWLTFVSINIALFSMLYLSIAGSPSRYDAYNTVNLLNFSKMIGLAFIVAIVTQLMLLYPLLLGLFGGKKRF